MQRFSILGFALLMAGLLALTSASGCGKRGDDNTDGDVAKLDRKKGGTTTTEPDKTKPGDGGGPKTGTKTALKAESSDGVIKGKVTFDGPPPPAQILEAIKVTNERACRDAPKWQQINQQWIVNEKNNGVANVMVYLNPPAGQYFPIDQNIAYDKVKEIDQPYCAFVPHVQVTFPYYWDGSKHVPSGQQFIVKNRAAFPHDANYPGPKEIGQQNLTVFAGKDLPIKFNAPKRIPSQVNLSCGFHPWMSAYVMLFDHPYAAVTDNDGNFEIKSVPTGVELQIIAWHEAKQNFDDRKITVKKGEPYFYELKVK